MSTAHAHALPVAHRLRLTFGAAGGFAGGIIFGLLMQMMGMLGMVAQLVGASAAAVGWLVHLAVSALIGAAYAVIFGGVAERWSVAVASGLGYGLVWWVLDGLILMPARLGMDLFLLDTTTMQSLMGHLVYGLVLGLVFAALAHRGHG